VRYEVDRVVAGHVLLLQEIGGVAFALAEDRDQHIGPGDLLAAGGLHVNHRALDDPLEAGRRLGVLAVVDHQAAQLVVEVLAEALLQPRQIDVAGAHDRGRLLIVEETEQQVLQCRVFVLATVRVRDRAMKGLFEVFREGGQGSQSFSIVHCSGC
jgi:hypothetical protein